MCRANKCGPGSPVCIYCSKTNHSSAYCRYRPRDNWEEPRHTPDALKTGATGKNLASVQPEIKLDSAHCNINSNPFSHIDGRGQNQHNGGSHRSQHREQASAAPRGEQMDNNPNFPPRRQQHAHFNDFRVLFRYTLDTLLPHSLHWHLTIQWPVMLLVDQ